MGNGLVDLGVAWLARSATTSRCYVSRLVIGQGRVNPAKGCQMPHESRYHHAMLRWGLPCVARELMNAKIALALAALLLASTPVAAESEAPDEESPCPAVQISSWAPYVSVHPECLDDPELTLIGWGQ